jgi:hypothetical protein
LRAPFPSPAQPEHTPRRPSRAGERASVVNQSRGATSALPSIRDAAVICRSGLPPQPTNRACFPRGPPVGPPSKCRRFERTRSIDRTFRQHCRRAIPTMPFKRSVDYIHKGNNRVEAISTSRCSQHEFSYVCATRIRTSLPSSCQSPESDRHYAPSPERPVATLIRAP